MHPSITEQLNSKFAEMVAAADLPISFGDHEAVRDFFHLLNPKYRPPARTKATALVRDRYTELKENVQSELDAAEFISITTDSATTINQTSMQAVTAHFIDKDWNLQSRLLENVGKISLRGITFCCSPHINYCSQK